MKVVYLNPSGQLGGAEVSLLDILASMRAAEPDWQLRLIVGEDGPLVHRAIALGVPATVIPYPPSLAMLGDAGAGGPAGHHLSRPALLRKLLSSGPAVVSYIRRLRHVLREQEPDVIHTNGFKMHLLGAWSRPSSVPVVWHIHDYVSARPVMGRALRRYASRCAMAITNSRSVAEDISTVCGNRLPVRTIYNGVDLKRFSPTGTVLDLDALSGLPPATSRTIRIGMLATLARWKGHTTFLKAMSLLPEQLPVRGYILSGAIYQTAGSQHSIEELRSLAAELGISHRVGFTGFVDHPAAAMRALDIVVHASTQPEPFGLVIVEGMACGRAVIASHAGGATELFTAGTDALSHPPGDAAALARCIMQLVEDADLRSRLGKASRATVEQRFDGVRLATDLIPIYREAVLSAS